MLCQQAYNYESRRLELGKLTSSSFLVRNPDFQNRDELLRVSSANIEYVRAVETSILFLSMVPKKGGDDQQKVWDFIFCHRY